MTSQFQQLISQAEGLDFRKEIVNETKYVEKKSVIRQRELIPDFFIEFLKLGFFIKTNPLDIGSNSKKKWRKPMAKYLRNPKGYNGYS